MSTTDNDSEEPTLYNPDEERTEELEDDPTEEELHLRIPEELARQLLEVSLHLGLSPSLVAARAIDMVCNEIGLVDEEDLSTDTLIQKYQTRLDLLHTLDFDVEQSSDDEEPGWDAVDRIIENAERVG